MVKGKTEMREQAWSPCSPVLFIRGRLLKSRLAKPWINEKFKLGNFQAACLYSMKDFRNLLRSTVVLVCEVLK